MRPRLLARTGEAPVRGIVFENAGCHMLEPMAQSSSGVLHFRRKAQYGSFHQVAVKDYFCSAAKYRFHAQQ
ncbi:hypothetical protein AAES_45403 [Amazona aestiva]|uniref:Uncharacterized protein n=1 Tax=Amazona aestiva TaxID=12930 RepID=A0A0Q3UTP3_AMAAE|nr:hypothetical protein AAES_45403 [Amazona aestiva]